MCKLLIFFVLIICVIIHSEKSAKYYKNLWNKNIEKSLKWDRRTSNLEFKIEDNKKCETYPTYDFVIVGAGSAGNVLANRLSEKWRVLLLEAGGEENDFSKIPAGFQANLLSEQNWGYLTTPQKNACFGMVDRRCDYSRGKVMGGGSAVNAMLWVRGNRRDFDEWEAMGNLGWSYKQLLPYFKKMENISSLDFNDEVYRGTKGPMRIAYPQPPPPFLQTILDANKEMGFKIVDYNGYTQINAGRMQVNTDFGRRYSTNEAYIKPIKKCRRRNLKILNEAFAIKIHFKNETAHSVHFLQKGKCFFVSAAKEIILSAGAINTPQLLMLSGIGPEEILKEHSIPVIKNLPVGQYLEDHLTTFMIPIKTNVTVQVDFDKEVEKYTKGLGWLTYTAVLEVGFYKVTDTLPDYPDIEIMYVLPKPFVPKEIMTKQSNYNEELDDYIESLDSTYLYLQIMLLRPKSQGYLTISSADPFDFPIIDPNYFSHPDDLEFIYKAIKNNQELQNTESFKKVNATTPNIPIKKCQGLNDKEYWYCVIRYLSQGIYHPVGTCRMGNKEVDSVVSSNLKVHGISKLRVVDASVIPKITSGHINAAAIVIAEKISDDIKKEYDHII